MVWSASAMFLSTSTTAGQSSGWKAVAIHLDSTNRDDSFHMIFSYLYRFHMCNCLGFLRDERSILSLIIGVYPEYSEWNCSNPIGIFACQVVSVHWPLAWFPSSLDLANDVETFIIPDWCAHPRNMNRTGNTYAEKEYCTYFRMKTSFGSHVKQRRT